MADEDMIPRPVPAGWLEAIARGEADLAAGRTVPVETVLAKARARLGRLERRQAREASDAA